MNSIFVDTSGWGNVVDSTETHHTAAISIYLRARETERRLVTTSYVILELVTLLHSPLRVPRPRAVEFIDQIKADKQIEIVHIDEDLDNMAWALIKERLDKDWSLVDAASFVVMGKLGITEALTNDHHFEQAGFVRLLK